MYMLDEWFTEFLLPLSIDTLESFAWACSKNKPRGTHLAYRRITLGKRGLPGPRVPTPFFRHT